MERDIVAILMQAGEATIRQLVLLLGPLLALALVMQQISKLFENAIIKLIGLRGYVVLFGWIGILIHELGHAVFCKLFGHDITEIQLFKPDMETGQMGYVNHAYNPRNPYHVIGNFFIGIGPLLMGAGLILLIVHFLAEEQLRPTFEQVGGALMSDLARLDFSNAGNQLFTLLAQMILLFKVNIQEPSWQFWLAIFLIACIGSGMTLSLSDIKSAFTGFLALLVTLYIVNLVIHWAQLGSLDAIFEMGATRLGAVSIAQLLAVILLSVMTAPVLLLSLFKK